jgi:heptosyltransferase III
MKTAAVLPALGIGDALLMMIASHQLKMAGYRVTTFHAALPELASWFPGHDLQRLPFQEELLSTLSSFDLILVENDNSPKIKQLIDAYRHSLSIFYPTYSIGKHAPLSSQDRIFDKNRPMADNIAEAIALLVNLPIPSKENGLSPPSGCIHRAKRKQALLHPTSREATKNWKSSGFLTVAHQLKKRGFDPLFCVSPQEQQTWKFIEKEGFVLANPPTLSALAALVYESGYVIGNDSLIGHLASNLGIPTLIIANDEKKMRLWRPGWLQGQLVLPPPYLPNWKFLRLKETKWQHFISPNKVLRSFNELISTL